MTEMWEDNMASSRHPTMHAMEDHQKAARHRVADKPDALIMGSLGRPNVNVNVNVVH